MRVSFWIDVWPWSDLKNLFVTQTPGMPKPSDAVRYRIDVDIPDFHADEDEIIQGKIKEEKG